jgi:hypothetical protein
VLVVLLHVPLVSGYTLTIWSDKATIGLYFTFTCVTTCTLILFNKDSITVYFISGSNTDGTCVVDEGYDACESKILNNSSFIWSYC